MGEVNTVPRKINKVEGTVGQGIVCQGAGVAEIWGGKLRWTANKLLQGAGTGADPTEIDVPSALNTTSGSYTGDGGNDRAIPHGLGETPKAVLVVAPGQQYAGVVSGTRCVSLFSDVVDVVTIWDATNFNVAALNSDLNKNAIAYNWVAFGS